jgi:hypothetical protein
LECNGRVTWWLGGKCCYTSTCQRARKECIIDFSSLYHRLLYVSFICMSHIALSDREKEPGAGFRLLLPYSACQEYTWLTCMKLYVLECVIMWSEFLRVYDPLLVTERVISKTKLMVFGLESIGYVVLLLNDGHEGRCATSGVCREMACVVQRVIRNGKCKQVLQHRPASALVPRVYLGAGMYCHLAGNFVFVIGQYWVQNGREISSSCVWCVRVSCVICVCVLTVSCRAMLNLLVAMSLTADCLCFSFIAIWNVRTDYLFLFPIR